jgi:PAS domain S-box-containing protein
MSITTKKNIIIIFVVTILTQILISVFIPIAGSKIGPLNFVPSLLAAWFWGPWIGLACSLISIFLSTINFLLFGLNFTDVYKNIIGISMPPIFSIGLGYLSIVLKRDKTLVDSFKGQSKALKASLEEKIKTEEALLEKIEFIRFSNKISSDFINIPPLLIESRIESAMQRIFDFMNITSCAIYIQFEGDKHFSLYKEFSKDNNNPSYHHIYKLKNEILTTLHETLIAQSHLEIDKQSWNHPIAEIFKADSIILLPLLSNNKLFGIISFEYFGGEKDWTKYHNEIFPLTKQVIAYAFERKFAEEKISNQYNELKNYSESLFNANQKLKNLNEILWQTTKELQESETKFRELSENLEDIIWLQSGKKLLYVNPAYEIIWGKKREELYKNPTGFVNIIVEEDRTSLINEFYSHNYETQKVFQREFRIICPDGKMKWILARSFLIDKENGNLKIAGIASDITLRKQTEEENKIALDKAIELSQLKSRFISTVSHELRTPLATILSSIELLKIYTDRMSAEEKSILYSRIIASIDYLTTVLDDVITIDKSESGYISVNYESFDLTELVKIIINNISILKNFKININFLAAHKSLKVISDKKLVTQIITNLLTNAIKFSQLQSPIDLNIKFDNNCFIIEITDKGIGIPIESQQSIFVPFYRAENAQNIQGTGLGLSIAKRWVDLLNGNISFNSKPFIGTTFTVAIPNKQELNIVNEKETILKNGI